MKEECKDHSCKECKLLREFVNTYLAIEAIKYRSAPVAIELMRHRKEHIMFLQDKLEKLEEQLITNIQ